MPLIYVYLRLIFYIDQSLLKETSLELPISLRSLGREPEEWPCHVLIAAGQNSASFPVQQTLQGELTVTTHVMQECLVQVHVLSERNTSKS